MEDEEIYTGMPEWWATDIELEGWFVGEHWELWIDGWLMDEQGAWIHVLIIRDSADEHIEYMLDDYRVFVFSLIPAQTSSSQVLTSRCNSSRRTHFASERFVHTAQGLV